MYLCLQPFFSYTLFVPRTADGTNPPTHATIAGAVAVANPPNPAVSVMALSPMSGFASASENPGNQSPLGTGAGAVNHLFPRLLTQMPASVPFLDIAVTSVLWGTSCAARDIALAAAIPRFSAVKLFSFMNLAASKSIFLSSPLLSVKGTTWRIRREVVALFLL